MTFANNIIWSEGMFILPQHFQQLQRHWHVTSLQKPSALMPYAYGFRELTLDTHLLEQGKIALVSASGIFPDGTAFSIPQEDSLPLPLDVAGLLGEGMVYLGLALQHSEKLPRYQRAVRSIVDQFSESEHSAEIELGQLNCRLMSEVDDRSQYAVLPLCRIKDIRPDKKVLLEHSFVPPLLELSAMPKLLHFVEEVHGLLQHRAEVLSARLAHSQQSESAVVSDLMLLQLMNRYESVFLYLAKRPVLHPEVLYQYSLQLLSEVSTYTKDTRRPIAMPAYQHEQLHATLSPMMQALRQCLSAVLEQHAVSIHLVQQNYGIYVAQVQDKSLLESSMIVLSVYAEMSPEELRKRFPRQVKLAPLEMIRDLVSRGVPGITLLPLTVAPRQIPYHANCAYFRINQQDELWKEVSKTGALGLHVGGKFKEIKVELWAVKD